MNQGLAPTSPESFSGFFDATSISIVVCDARADDLPIIYVNQAFETTTGYSRAFAIGRNCRFLQGEDTLEDNVARIRTALDHGDPIEQTLMNYRADGTGFLNDLVITPILDSAGRPRFFVGVQRAYASEEEREALSQPGHDLIAKVQRLVRSHLDVVLEISKVLGEQSLAEDKRSEGFLKRVVGLDALYQNAVSQKADADQVDMGVYISQIVSSLMSRSTQSGIRVNVNTESVDVPVDLAIRAGILIHELVENAFAHAFTDRERGLIEVSAREEEGRLVIDLFDDGIGFPDGLDWPRDGGFGGLVVDRMRDVLGADISIDVRQDGTDFEVRIPV